MTTNLPLTTAMPALNSSPVDTSAATTYTDLNGLAALKKDPNSPQAISAVAQQVEALFLQMMLKSMRDASSSSDPDSNEMGMYQDMFDKQVALTISQHQDLGIGAMLKRQLSGKTATPADAAALKPAQSPAQAGRASVGRGTMRAPSSSAHIAGGIRQSGDAGHPPRGLRLGTESSGIIGAGCAGNRLGAAHGANRRRVSLVSICSASKPAIPRQAQRRPRTRWSSATAWRRRAAPRFAPMAHRG